MLGTSLSSFSMIPEGITVPHPTTTSWRRRTLKACANCRRDKIKCDGGRPCSSCIKKRFQCVDGCEPCRKARVRCEHDKPCKRCREHGLECKDETEHTPSSPIFSSVDLTSAVAYPPGPSAASTEAPQNSRLKTSERVKLACLSCRRDNKKCDDERPCRRCVARDQDCIHVGNDGKQAKPRCNGCRQDNRKCEDARPCKRCVCKGIECVDAPRKGRGYGIRVKAACTGCRRDKVRCDGGRPCARCKRKGVQCVAQPCAQCQLEGRSARACKHATPNEPPLPNVSHEDSSSSSQMPTSQFRAVPSASSYHTMAAPLPQYASSSQSAQLAGVQHIPEVHVSHYPVQSTFAPVPNIAHYSLPARVDANPLGPGSTHAYSSFAPTYFPTEQTSSADVQYCEFSMAASTHNYGHHDPSGRMVSAERYVG
ncbi:hypothetical protein OE88DRAFT_541761 [Heliocybe sulcata]|uniref:Transcription activator of gluconeogenesis ERT1 n=1 Tax=Heliocybe sulcata TaxID=5364 RepID=A0A5C3MXT0_9AGAM|nr:hypothetical protein OE88DRAFT_541761 [Heliocybe sulcata]